MWNILRPVKPGNKLKLWSLCLFLGNCCLAVIIFTLFYRENDKPCTRDAFNEITANAAKHYSHSYFAWQSKNTDLGGKITSLLFKDYVDVFDDVLDFGCGSGTVLSNLHVRKRLCVEVNPVARFEAEKILDHVFKDLESVPDMSVSAIISNHALEHTTFPAYTLWTMKRKLRKGGKLILCVPSLRDEMQDERYSISDQHHHLYVWSPKTLGNLVNVTGFQVLEADVKKYSRTSASDEAFIRQGPAGFWNVATTENRHPQTFLYGVKLD